MGPFVFSVFGFGSLRVLSVFCFVLVRYVCNLYSAFCIYLISFRYSYIICNLSFNIRTIINCCMVLSRVSSSLFRFSFILFCNYHHFPCTFSTPVLSGDLLRATYLDALMISFLCSSFIGTIKSRRDVPFPIPLFDDLVLWCGCGIILHVVFLFIHNSLIFIFHHSIQ